MNTVLTQYAVVTVIKGLEKYGTKDYTSIAQYIKGAFANKFGNTWHCIVMLRGGYGIVSTAGGYICLDIGE